MSQFSCSSARYAGWRGAVTLIKLHGTFKARNETESAQFWLMFPGNGELLNTVTQSGLPGRDFLPPINCHHSQVLH